MELHNELERNIDVYEEKNSPNIIKNYPSHNSVMICEGEMEFSTPINNKLPSTPNIHIPNISDCSRISSSNTISQISDPPSGFTDELKSLGPNWPDSSIEEGFQIIVDCNEKGNPAIISTLKNNKLPSTLNHQISNTSEKTSTAGVILLHHTLSENVSQDIIHNTGEPPTSTSEIVLNQRSPFKEIPRCQDSVHYIKGYHSTNSPNSDENNLSKDNDHNETSYNPGESTYSDTHVTSIEKSSIIDRSSSFDNSTSIDIQKLVVPCSIPETGKSKKHFCLYCKQLQTKFARHLVIKHKTEAEVKKFINLPSCSERKNIIDFIRKKGDFMHNTKPEFNTGILIVPRQRQNKSNNSAEDYICCKTCKAFFSRKTIRIHAAKCDPAHKKGTRNVLNGGRRAAGFIHYCANTTLRRVVFPILRDDDVVRCIKYDELIIKYGNKLCDKYTLTHQHDLIRAQLRLLGRFKLAMMSIDKEIRELKDVFRPRKFYNSIASLRNVAEWDEKIGWFVHPGTAQNLTTLLKKCASKLRTECIKSEDFERKGQVDDFLLLWEEEVPSLINKRALEDQMNQKRKKKVILPSKQDIKLLYDYIKKECNVSPTRISIKGNYGRVTFTHGSHW